MTTEELEVWLNLQTNPNVKGEIFVDRRREMHLTYLMFLHTGMASFNYPPAQVSRVINRVGVRVCHQIFFCKLSELGI